MVCLRTAAAGLVAAAMLVATVSAGQPTRLTIKALNKSSAIINMTDDITFGTLQWHPDRRMTFDDDVAVRGRVVARDVVNDEFTTTVESVDKILDCSSNMEIYDRKTDACAVVSSKYHNNRVRDFIMSATYQMCIIMWDYSVRCWGYAGDYCMLGYGDGTNRHWPTENPMTYEQPSMQRRLPNYRIMDMYPVAMEYFNTAVVREDGTVWMVGYGGHGAIGDGSTSTRHYYKQTSYLHNVTAVVAGGHSTEGIFCALEGDGTQFCWGYNNAGQCGVGHTSNVKSPTRTLALTDVKMNTLSRESTSSACSVRHDGTVWCWGYNGYGQLANGGTGNRDSPSQVGGSDTLYLQNVDYVKAHGGSVTTFFALTNDHKVYSWGYNGHGQCGVGDTSNKYKAVAVQDTSGTPMDDVMELYTCNGSQYGPICVIREDRSVWCWGYNNHGQLGVGDSSQRNRATRVDRTDSMPIRTLHNPSMISHSYGYHSVCAIAEETLAVWCWGFNNYGQLGLGHTSERNSPQQVMNIGRTILLGSRAYHASNGDTTFYALSEDGYTIWAWGYSGHGQVGSHRDTIGTNNIPQRVRLE